MKEAVIAACVLVASAVCNGNVETAGLPLLRERMQTVEREIWL